MLYGEVLVSVVTLQCLWLSCGYALMQCYNGSGPVLPRNEPGRGRVNLESVWVSSPGASCGPLSISNERTSSNYTCPERQHPEDCSSIKRGTEDEEDDLPECEKKMKKVQYQMLYKSMSQFSVHLQWDPIPGVTSYNVMIFQRRKICASVVNNTEYWFSARYWIFDYSFDTWNVKISVPGENCLRASVTTAAPRNCLILCPGMCDCLEEDPILQAPIFVNSCIWDEENDTVSLRVSWEPVERYYLGLPSNTFHVILYNTSAVVMETLKVMGTTSVYVNLRGINMAQTYYVQVAHVICNEKPESRKELISFQRCQVPTSAKLSNQNSSSVNASTYPISANNTNSTVKPNANTTAVDAIQTTSTNLPISSSVRLPILVGVTVAFFIAVVVLVALLIIMLITLKKSRFKGKLQDCSRLHPSGGKNGKDKTVLVLFSQASSVKDEMSVMEHVVKGVSLYSGVHCLYFDKPSVRTSVAEWVEGAIKRSDKVLLVVNKEFVKEWDSLKAYLPHGESLIYVARQVVDSFVMRDKQQLSKFALVFLRKEDQRSLLKDSLYLQTVKSFLVLPQAMSELEGLVRFILDVPTYSLPFKS